MSESVNLADIVKKIIEYESENLDEQGVIALKNRFEELINFCKNNGQDNYKNIKFVIYFIDEMHYSSDLSIQEVFDLFNEPKPNPELIEAHIRKKIKDIRTATLNTYKKLIADIHNNLQKGEVFDPEFLNNTKPIIEYLNGSNPVAKKKILSILELITDEPTKTIYKNALNEGGKRKSRRNRKTKKGKKPRKARKSRRKSNRRRGRR
jgi:hypothetical protein